MIIVGYDSSPWSEAALTWAADEAGRTGAPLQLVYADESPVNDAAGTLDRAVARVKTIQPLIDVTARIERAPAARALVDLSLEAGLIVVGARGHSAVGGLLGSVSTAVSAHARCPVVVARGEPASHATVVAGVDGSALASSVLTFAAEHAAARKATLRVVRAWPPVTGLWEETAMATYTVTAHEREPFDAMVTEVRDTFPDLTVEAEATVAHPAGALVRASAGAQLLVVGSRGHGALAGLLLGSVSQHLLRHSECTVAVVHRTR
ncbi:universal stress protein [Actinoplanes sp. NPDC051861]|uniref:universal stress protein n=1 Tax=Actinoplanes sp. NPDC051861 TaxID=3155170 RepID=UPI00343F607D